MYRTLLFLITLTIPFFNYAEGDLPLSITDGGSPSIVNGCVSVFEGDYVESSCDMFLRGAENLSFERFYSSSSSSEPFYGWRHNHGSSLEIACPPLRGYKQNLSNEDNYPEPSTIISIYCSKKDGRGAAYSGCQKSAAKKMSYEKGSHVGFTNIGHGTISARNRLKNTYISYHGSLKNLVIKDENGSKSHFEEIYSATGGQEDYEPSYYRSYLKKDEKSNGNALHYEYKSLDITAKKKLKKVKATDSTGNILYSSFTLRGESEVATKKKFVLEAHDGRTVTYNLSSGRIRGVIKPDAPYDKYEYCKLPNPYFADSSHCVIKLSKKRRPQGRFLGVEYYEYTKTKKKLNPESGRVKKLTAPVGFDNAPLTTHEFVYSRAENKKKEFTYGVTQVYDNKRHLTTYGYPASLRLDFIEKYKGVDDHKIYSRENFIWNDEGELTCHYLNDGAGIIHAARTFDYDDKGNLLKNSFYGNLQGKPTNITLNHKKRPNQLGCNSWTVHYRYSKDERNLLLEETHQNGKSIKYGYHPHQDLLVSKLTLDHGQIKIREFYNYDQYGLICRYTIDDGVSEDRYDLNGVTEQRFTCTLNQSKIPVGLPIIIDEYCLDIATGNGLLIKRLQNEYSAEGHLLKQETYDANNTLRLVEHFQYDAHGNVILEENPLQLTTVRTYNKNDECLSERTSRVEKSQEYDFSGRVISSKELHDDGSVVVLSNTYDTLHNLVATIDPFGHETTHEYDELGRLVKTKAPTYIDPLGNSYDLTISKAYDIFGNVTKSQDQLGRITTTTFNARGKPISIAYPNGACETFKYRDDGSLKKSIAKNGLTTYYTHDCLGRLLKKELYSDGVLLQQTSSEHNSFHKLTDIDELGVVTYYSYDYSGKLKSTSKNETLTEFEYDELQRLHKTKQWTNKTSYSLKIQGFDLLNRVIEERMEDETGVTLRHVQFVYDEMGNQIEVIQHQGNEFSSTKTSYDSFKRPIKIVDPDGAVTLLSYNMECYNAHGQKVLETCTIDPLGNQTITMMNIFGKPETIRKKNIDGQEISKKEIGYNPVGNISFTLETAMTPDQPIRTVMTKWEYNDEDNLIKLTEAAGTVEQKVTEHAYNLAGEKILTIKPDGQHIHYSYNALGQLMTFDSSDGSFSYLYEYDDRGNLIKSIDKLNFKTTFRFYDTNNLMIKEVLGTGFEINYSYDYIGRPVQVTLPDGSFIRYEYNPLNLKKVRRYSKEEKEIFSHEYTSYDLSGNLLEEQYLNGSGKILHRYGLSGQLLQTDSDLFAENLKYDLCKNLKGFEITKTSQDVTGQFTYDDLYQLKSEEGVASHRYTHDSLNNCVIKDGKPQETNALNQLLKTLDTTYSYDGNGNRISDETKKYTYDALDRLTCVSLENEKIFYSYDSFNRRLSKTRKDQTNKILESIHYLYFGQNEVGSYDENGNLKEFRTLGTGKGAEIGATVGIEIGDQLYFPFHDHNGNIVSLVDSKSLQVVDDYRFTAFGEEVGVSSTGNPWRFSSKRVDEETGFVNFGRRYYDAKTAKWISPDPIGFDGGPNLYAYVMNNPLTHIDLYGLESYCPRCGRAIDRDGRDLRTNIRDGIDRLRSGIERLAGRVRDFARNVLDYKSREVRINNNSEVGFEKKSQIIATSDYNRPVIPNIEFMFVPGILNELCDARKNSIYLSNTIGGYHVTTVFTQTHGGPRDIINVTNAIFRGMGTVTVSKVHEAWNTAFAKNKDVRILMYDHSAGCAYVNLALRSYPENLRERIFLANIAPASYTPKELCGGVWHYASEGDFVPLFDFQGRMACRDTTTVLKRAPGADLFDHAFDSPTYRGPIQAHAKDFIKTYGR